MRTRPCSSSSRSSGERRARWTASLGVAAALSTWLPAACIDRLPDQDLRIVAATPVARMSADILWAEYQEDRDRADAAYWGRAIVVTGTVTTAGTDTPGDRHVLFGQTEEQGVRAMLLDDGATEILSSLPEDRRLTLKCFCDGVSGDVVLRSCVRS